MGKPRNETMKSNKSYGKLQTKINKLGKITCGELKNVGIYCLHLRFFCFLWYMTNFL